MQGSYRIRETGKQGKVSIFAESQGNQGKFREFTSKSKWIFFLSYHHEMNFNFSVILGLVCSIYSGTVDSGKILYFSPQKLRENSGKNNFKSV